jgi:non-ribosomal peptide synthetase component E (peptide arylation enzyme)
MLHAVTMGSWVTRHASRTPDKAALIFKGRTITYAALDTRARQVAAGLSELGVRKLPCASLHEGRTAIRLGEAARPEEPALMIAVVVPKEGAEGPTAPELRAFCEGPPRR